MTRGFDVAVIGPGTVGLYLAAALPAGLTVALVGGPLAARDLLGPDPDTAGHAGVLSGWAGGLGGSSTRWGGQLWPWQAWEVQGGPHRDPWPIDHATDLAPHYRRALSRLGLDAAQRTAVHGAGRRRWPRFATERTEVRYSTWMDRRHRDFRLNRALAARDADVTAVPVNVARIEPRPGGRHALIDAAGDELLVAREVVLAAGTLGTVRALQRYAESTGSTRPVGRFFGDHVSTRAAAVEVVDRARFTALAAPSFIRDGRATVRLATTAAHVAATGAMPAYAHFEVASPSVAAVRALARARGAALPGAAAGVLRQAPRLPGQLAETARSFAVRRRPLDPAGAVFLRIDVEQPLRASAGMRWRDDGSLQLDWGVGAEEHDAARAALAAIGPLLEAEAGVRLTPLDSFDFQDIYHLMGGARMGSADDPTAVVGPDLAVHDAPGLWVAGAAVFRSGGMANPTFTALALADRLADHLAGRLGTDGRPPQP